MVSWVWKRKSQQNSFLGLNNIKLYCKEIILTDNGDENEYSVLVKAESNKEYLGVIERKHIKIKFPNYKAVKAIAQYAKFDDQQSNSETEYSYDTDEETEDYDEQISDIDNIDAFDEREQTIRAISYNLEGSRYKKKEARENLLEFKDKMLLTNGEYIYDFIFLLEARKYSKDLMELDSHYLVEWKKARNGLFFIMFIKKKSHSFEGYDTNTRYASSMIGLRINIFNRRESIIHLVHFGRHEEDEDLNFIRDNIIMPSSRNVLIIGDFNFEPRRMKNQLLPEDYNVALEKSDYIKSTIRENGKLIDNAATSLGRFVSKRVFTKNSFGSDHYPVDFTIELNST